MVTAQEAQDGSVTVRLPRQGLEFQARKVVDPDTGETTTVATTLDGRKVDYLAAVRQEQALASIPAFKVTTLLRDQLAVSDGARIPVHVWLNFAPDSVDFRPQLETELRAGMPYDLAKAALVARVKAANAINVEPAIAYARTLGLPLVRADEFAPFITVMADANEVEMLASQAIVDRLYGSVTFQDTQIDAILTHRWDRVHDFGIRGDGVQVAVLEDNGIDDAACVSSILNVIGWNNANHNIQNHPTGGASVIGSMDATFPGHARGIQLLSANGTNAAGNPSYVDTDIIAAANWAINQGADVINCSFGFNNTPQALQMTDRFVDYAVRLLTTTFAVSAGNNGNVAGNVSTPGVAYNCITVGAIDDANTADWADDVVASYSSVVDPTSTHGDREKPEVCAEGTDMDMLNLGCAFTYNASGTSFAAPGVAGMCGALMQMDTTLQGWPEVMKAIMMAAATHNLEGSSRLSDKDGAGAMNGLQAYRIVEGRKYLIDTLTPSDFTATGYQTYDIWLQGGDKTRVVLCWDSLANGTYSTDVLEADLDIAIFAGQGTTTGVGLSFSSSWDNPYEIVEFCPAATGWYTVRINDYRFDGTSEYIGLAWTQDVDGRHARYRPWLPVSTSTDLTGPTMGNSTFWVDPEDPHHGSNRAFLCLASLGVGTGFDFPAACRHSYGDLDLLTYIFYDPTNPFFINYAGTYSASGTTLSTRLAVADIPGLEGFTLYLNNFTIDGASPEGIREIARVEPITLWGHATELTLGDDGFSGPIPIGFPFPFFGGTYTECYVNANGNITFGGGDSTYTETLTGFTGGLPRIAPLWDDLNMNIGGKIRVRSGGPIQFVVEWAAVPEYATTATNQNSVLLILHADGTIDFKYRDCDLLDAIVGITAGGGVSSTAVDASHGYKRLFGSSCHEVFTGAAAPFDLALSSSYRNKLRFTRNGIASYTLSLDSN